MIVAIYGENRLISSQKNIMIFLLLNNGFVNALKLTNNFGVSSHGAFLNKANALKFTTGLTSAVSLNAGGRSYSTGRLSKNKRNSFSINSDLKQVLIGLCLGDLCITKQGKNPRLQFA